MIELRSNQLVFSFPEVHPHARLRVEFQRTLRIPDDDREYPLPPGLGKFPLRHVDDFGADVPSPWIEHGGVMLPMYQSEALWLNFNPEMVPDRWASYPFAIKVCTGKINAVTGHEWSDGLRREPQDYMVAPDQPWLDGYVVKKGVIRQFVAMPLGEGYTAEEQITGAAEHGGLQIIAYPMKREVFERRFPKREREATKFARVNSLFEAAMSLPVASAEMGLAPGGRMRQKIYEDEFELTDWSRDASSRCFVHIANSLVWRAITGDQPPTVPPTSKEYDRAGLPWFEYFSDGKAVPGAGKLAQLKSVLGLAKEKGGVPIPENESADAENVVALRKGLGEHQVREWS